MSLSTHVLDTVSGRPGRGRGGELRREGAVVASVETNEDGRATFGEVGGGEFELEFAVGDYFGERAVPGSRSAALPDRRSRRALPRAAARLAVGVQHVPRQLTVHRSVTPFVGLR